MTDYLVKRLRVRAEFTGPYSALWDEAADRIEQLEARIKEVEAAHFISCRDSVSTMEDIENQEKRIEQLEAANLKASLIKIDDELRIEQLEAELHSCFHRIEELQAALRLYACESTCQNCYGQVQDTRYCGLTARNALGGKNE